MVQMEYIGEQDGLTLVLMYDKCYKCGAIKDPQIKFIENTVH